MEGIDFVLLLILMLLIFLVEAVETKLEYNRELYKCYTLMMFKYKADEEHGCQGNEEYQKDCKKCIYHKKYLEQLGEKHGR